MTEWNKYSFVCNGDCEALLEFTFKDGFGFPASKVVEPKCPCGSDTTYVSYATVINKEVA